MKKVALVLLSISLYSSLRSAEERIAVSATEQLRDIVFKLRVDTEVLESFLASAEGYDINAKPTQMFKDFTPLRFHSYYGNREVCNVLLRYGADTNDGDPFITALTRGHLGVAQLFQATDPGLIERYQDRALDAAIAGRSSDCITWLLSCGIPVPPYSQALLINVLQNGLHDFAQVLLEGTDIEASPELLHAAAIGGNVAVCRLLLERGVSVDAQDEDGFTPLFHARGAERQEVATLLERWNGHATHTSANFLDVTTSTLDESGALTSHHSKPLTYRFGLYALKLYGLYRRCTDPCRGKPKSE